MTKTRVSSISVSVDGYAAGPNQDVDHPLGVGGGALHTWALGTQTFAPMQGLTGGSTGLDDEMAQGLTTNIGAHIIGRNMFGPIRGEWTGEWNGWWGTEPPYNHDVYVLTHHAREPLKMENNTVFYFVDNLAEAHERAVESANGQDVLIGGGAATIQQFLAAGLIDEMHIAVVPVLLGNGERLFANIADLHEHYECTGMQASDAATHYSFVKR